MKKSCISNEIEKVACPDCAGELKIFGEPVERLYYHQNSSEISIITFQQVECIGCGSKKQFKIIEKKGE